MNTKMIAFAVGVMLSAPSIAVAAPHKPGTAEIPKFVGGVSAENVEPFLNMVSDHQDKIIGLHVAIDGMKPKAEPANGYSADLDQTLFVVSYGTLEKPGIELVVPKAEATWLHGNYVLDGFYIVKSGGMHQGTLSYGLEKVDEGAVLLSPKYQVVEKTIR